ncbi:MAG: hypothetical protein AB7E70_05715 [Hyphomicrobiaceae bacterium]
MATAALVAFGAPIGAMELPREVTPAIRAACETDVRRLCIQPGATIETVKACVRRNFRKLNPTCRLRLVRAGL